MSPPTRRWCKRNLGTTMNQPASAYFLEERHDPNESHTLSVLVQNEPGVLARVIDATTESFVFEITGNSAKISQFIDLMRPLGLVEVSRTGVAAIGRGPEGMCAMLARDWYYNERRQIGLDSAVASIYGGDDDSDLRARAALTTSVVQSGWGV